MAICRRTWCGFVIWTLFSLTIERINFDENFWNDTRKKLEQFYDAAVLLHGKSWWEADIQQMVAYCVLQAQHEQLYNCSLLNELDHLKTTTHSILFSAHHSQAIWLHLTINTVWISIWSQVTAFKYSTLEDVDRMNFKFIFHKTRIMLDHYMLAYLVEHHHDLTCGRLTSQTTACLDMSIVRKAAIS